MSILPSTIEVAEGECKTWAMRLSAEGRRSVSESASSLTRKSRHGTDLAIEDLQIRTPSLLKSETWICTAAERGRQWCVRTPGVAAAHVHVDRVVLTVSDRKIGETILVKVAGY